MFKKSINSKNIIDLVSQTAHTGEIIAKVDSILYRPRSAAPRFSVTFKTTAGVRFTVTWADQYKINAIRPNSTVAIKYAGEITPGQELLSPVWRIVA